MALFTTRVELHDASAKDYDLLHEEMKKRGFLRVITSDSGITFHLPFAEYTISGALTREGVLERAEAAATTTRRKAALLVTEAIGRTWSGLDRV